MARDEGSCSSSSPHPWHITCCPAPDRRPSATKALHTICGNNTSIVSSSWWWAYKCPKHVQQITSAINHSVASSWFSSLRLYYDARTNIHTVQREECFVRQRCPLLTVHIFSDERNLNVWNDTDRRIPRYSETKNLSQWSLFPANITWTCWLLSHVKWLHVCNIYRRKYNFVHGYGYSGYTQGKAFIDLLREY